MGPLELQKEKVLMIVTENRFVDEELIISILILKKVVIIHRQYNVVVCSFFFADKSQMFHYKMATVFF